MTWTQVVWLIAMFAAGAGVGVAVFALLRRRQGERVTLNHTLGAAILAAAVGATVLGVYNSVSLWEQARCQAQVNRAFLSTLTGNAELAERDREALDEVFRRLAEEEGVSPEVIREYLAVRTVTEDERDEYPPLPQEVCDMHGGSNEGAAGTTGGDEDQDQAALVRDTGNGPTEEDELEVLEELYGPPDADGVYGPRGDDVDEEGGR